MGSESTKLLFLGCNFDQIPYLQEILARGYKVVGTDRNSFAPGRNMCDLFFPVGYDQVDSLLEIGEQLCFGSKDKVFTASSQFAHLSAAKFAEHFNILYPKPNHVNVCLDKVSFYEVFSDLGIPIPFTKLITTKSQLDNELSCFSESCSFFLKSDFSKNPNYVYRFRTCEVDDIDIFWGRDRYFRKFYVLQKEFQGKPLRINLYGERFNVYDFEKSTKVENKSSTCLFNQVVETLKTIRKYFGMENWLLKFDIVLGEKNFVVLDIGMDPPYRMNETALEKSIVFSKHYVTHYLDGVISYPRELD